jgi:hypothetical protein
METEQIFNGLLASLKVGEKAKTVRSRRDEITKALNKNFRDKDASVEYRLMIGSFGRHTAIRSISDLDMIFILPSSLRGDYSEANGPRRMLERVRDVLTARYPNTDIRVDQCVVRVQFVSDAFKFEVQPAFENEDGSFDYPDTKAESWKTTKPRAEIAETRECNDRTSTNMRHLARMTRAWKNTNGVNLGGLVIDTLVNNFFAQTSEFDFAKTGSFDVMSRDFFEFLMHEPEKDYYLALGSRQRVHVKAKFKAKAKKAYNRCVSAIELEGKTAAVKKWREVFGTGVPLTAPGDVLKASASATYIGAEEFIEDHYPVDITESVYIDCEVTQKGWRPTWLRSMRRVGDPLLAGKRMKFQVKSCSASEPYVLKWKVLNQGSEAEKRRMIRGDIIDSTEPGIRKESSSFRGEHIVECYVVKNGIVVARDRIDVPIITTVDV